VRRTQNSTVGAFIYAFSFAKASWVSFQEAVGGFISEIVDLWRTEIFSIRAHVLGNTQLMDA